MSWGFLDDLSEMGSNLYGKAVEIGSAAIDSIKVGPEPEKVVDKTPVQSENKLPVITLVDQYKTPIMIGGAVVLGVVLLYALKKR